MKIQTKYHGEIIIESESILSFPNGIPGFLKEQEFILLPLSEESPFSILQSVKNSELGFVLINPFKFYSDYEFKLSDSDVNSLDIENREQIEVYSIITVKDPFEDSTTNLQAPVVINGVKKLGRQVVLNHKDYHTKHKLISQTSPVGQEG
ncbi:flagellar assembly protein FliW [Bacillus salitolerans]|uniref:Flagellar assembly factor FliW n=1 Tax=Bacillus salitolerans TaxID=1437434 RepID=A0ABW4LQK6_9BACI